MSVTFSLRVNNDLPIEEFADLAARAEAHGFGQIWYSHDLFLRAAPVALTAAALRTERIRLGAGILNPYSLHPSEIAMVAASLQEVSGDRFLLGLGAGAEEFLGWAGLDRPRPLARTRDAVRAVRALLDGRSPEGWRAEAHLRVRPRPTPIYVGAMSPKMLALAGAEADGVLALLYPPEHYTVAMEQVGTGIAGAGRDPAEMDRPACVWCSVATDADAARRPLAEKIAYYGASFAPYLLQRAGLSVADFAPIQAALAAGEPDRARTLVTGKMLSLGIAGTPEDVIARCRGLIGAGARHLSFGPPLGPDLNEAVDLLGTKVLPALRAV